MSANALGAEFRRFDNRQRDGKPARAVVATRRYDTDPADLWDALTNRERLPRWFLPVEGDLKPGGRYQLKGNAGGTITRCEPPRALDLTWEVNGAVSWVTVRLAPDGAHTLLTLEHIVLASDSDEHWAKYGPAAVGIGWELSLAMLGRHIAGGGAALDEAQAHAWMGSEDGKTFMRDSGNAWAEAHIAGGEDPETARAMAARTIAFYTGG
jgi:uncharacterized protein YndB with AHSA1/START domain